MAILISIHSHPLIIPEETTPPCTRAIMYHHPPPPSSVADKLNTIPINTDDLLNVCLYLLEMLYNFLHKTVRKINTLQVGFTEQKVVGSCRWPPSDRHTGRPALRRLEIHE